MRSENHPEANRPMALPMPMIETLPKMNHKVRALTDDKGGCGLLSLYFSVKNAHVPAR